MVYKIPAHTLFFLYENLQFSQIHKYEKKNRLQNISHLFYIENTMCAGFL